MGAQVAIAHVAHLEGAEARAADHQRRPDEGVAATLSEDGRVRPRSRALAQGYRPCGGVVTRRPPVGEGKAQAFPTCVLARVVEADVNIEVVVVRGEDLTTRGPGESDQPGGRADGHFVGGVGEDPRELREHRPIRGRDAVVRRRRLGGRGRLGAERGGGRRRGDGRCELDVGGQRHDLVQQVAPVAAGTAVRGNATRVRPAADGVGAHPEQARDVGDPEPGRPVRSLGHRAAGHGRHVSSIGGHGGELYRTSHVLRDRGSANVTAGRRAATTARGRPRG